jgi:hypothetical protein
MLQAFRCAVQVLRLLRDRRLHIRHVHVGSDVALPDGRRYIVFRETSCETESESSPVMLAVWFRLRAIPSGARLRRRHVEFRRDTFLKGAASRASVKDVTWLNVRGTEIKHDEWHDEHLRTFGIWFGKRNSLEGRLLLLLNAADSAQTFALPSGPVNEPWIRQFDTSLDSLETVSLGAARDYRLDASSAALLEC